MFGDDCPVSAYEEACALQDALLHEYARAMRVALLDARERDALAVLKESDLPHRCVCVDFPV